MTPITQKDNSKSNLKVSQLRNIYLETIHLGSDYTKKRQLSQNVQTTSSQP